MLVTMKEILAHANAENYAVAAPNVCSEIDARAVIAAAEEMNAPVILDIGPLQCPDFVLTGQYMCRIAEKSRVPIAINLDHGGSAQGRKGNTQVIQDMMNAIKGGFTSVMIDRSSLPYEENVACVKVLAEVAHTVGVSVEAELGHVGDGKTFSEFSNTIYTDPELAEDYVNRTGIDCLAVSVGNSHGSYFCETPHINFELLAELKKRVGIPLVMHGGSGTGTENLYKACRLGINKVNLYTGMVSCMCSAVQKADFRAEKAYDFWAVWQDAAMDYMTEKIRVFGSDNKAWIPDREVQDQKQYLFRQFSK